MSLLHFTASSAQITDHLWSNHSVEHKTKYDPKYLSQCYILMLLYMSDKFDGQGHRSKFAVVGRKNAVNCLKSESKSVEKTSV